MNQESDKQSKRNRRLPTWFWLLIWVAAFLLVAHIIYSFINDGDRNEEINYLPPPPPPDAEGTLWGGVNKASYWQTVLLAKMKEDIAGGLTFRKPDLSKMILIPSGKAIIGALEHPHGNEQRLPLQELFVGAFYIDRTEVTNEQYAQCVKSRQCLPKGKCGHVTNCDTPDRPALLTFYQAQRYCIWMGKRLPTEIEWEKAARGTDGRIYPWGSEPPNERHGNICGKECSATPSMTDWQDDYEYTAPVDSFPDGDSPYGLKDVAGNVKEWVVADTKLTGNQKIARGASWYSQRVEMFPYYRQVWVPGVRLDDKGVRCVADVQVK